jgi:alpha-galactosidase
MPRGFAGLLCNQVAVHDLTAEAVLSGSRDAVIQALLVDAVVDKVDAAVDLVEMMISQQAEYLGYIK